MGINFRDSLNLPEDPYKELLAFEMQDEQIFFGRESDAKALQRKIARDRLTVLHARSGAGKTSLINAGLMPRLITAGYVPVYARAHTDPVQAIKNRITTALSHIGIMLAEPPGMHNLSLHQFLSIAESGLEEESRGILIILDQFEEFFILNPKPDLRLRFIKSLTECYADPVLRSRILLAIRKDYFSDLAEIGDHLPNVYQNEYLLRNMERDQAADAITRPVHVVDPTVNYDLNLLSELLNDLETNGMELPHLQIICSQLYSDRSDQQKLIALEDYRKFGGASGILGNYLDKTLSHLQPEERGVAEKVLFELVTSERTKRIMEFEQLRAATQIAGPQLNRVLTKLVDARLLRRDKETTAAKTMYEMAHEYLVDTITKRIEADPENKSFKQAQELLRGVTNSWRQGIPMNRLMLERIHQYRERLGELTDDEYGCILIASILENLYTAYWVNRDSNRAIKVIGLTFKSKTVGSRIKNKILTNLRSELFNNKSEIQETANSMLQVINTDEAREALEIWKQGQSQRFKAGQERLERERLEHERLERERLERERLERERLERESMTPNLIRKEIEEWIQMFTIECQAEEISISQLEALHTAEQLLKKIINVNGDKEYFLVQLSKLQYSKHLVLFMVNNLSNPNGWIRLASVRTLANIRAREALPVIRNFAMLEENFGVNKAIATALVSLR